MSATSCSALTTSNAEKNLLVIAFTCNEALSHPDDDKLSGAVFTKMARVFDEGRSLPVSVGRPREYLHEPTDAKNTANQIKGNSLVKRLRLTGATGMPRVTK